MATWTELLGEAERAVENVAPVRFVPAMDLRELLLDLPHHPNLSAVRAVTVVVGDQRAIMLAVPPGEAMSSGASGPIVPNAGVQRDTVQPWRVTPVLGDAGTAPEPEVVTLAQEEFTPPAVTTAQPFALNSAGWLDGIKWEPKRSPGGIILETE